jgi:aspartate/methionine/tyrosine aminotransferase
MITNRLAGMKGIGVDRASEMAIEADDENILRMENLDTDLAPSDDIIEETRKAISAKGVNSYLPYHGKTDLRVAAATLVSRLSGVKYNYKETTVITAGGLNGIFNTLLALLDPGDEVILPDPVYSGLINRVLLAGGKPVFMPSFLNNEGVWESYTDILPKITTKKTKAFLMLSPVMPSGQVFTRRDWDAICRACIDADAWMIYDAAMGRILYDNLEYIHPASFPGMAERTITVGSVSKEFCMTGWRTGWITAPPSIFQDIAFVNISNTVCPSGITQSAAALAIRKPDMFLEKYLRKWQARRDFIIKTLKGYPIIKPGGGWSMLLDVSKFGMNGEEAAKVLLEKAKIAVTPMNGWGSNTGHFVRIVFSNEPIERLVNIRERMDKAFG